MALCALRRADSPLQETHRGEALPVRRVQPLLLPLRPPGAAHEETPELEAELLLRVPSPPNGRISGLKRRSNSPDSPVGRRS